MKTDLTIFVVDDDEAVRDSLCLLLESAGYSVSSFPSAEAFLEGCTEDRYGLLLLDIRMPGMNGLQLQNALIERQLMLPIIFITGHGDIPMAVKAIQRGASDFLAKPFAEHELLERINDIFKEHTNKLHEIEENRKISQRINTLTERETEIMALIAEGKANKVIAIDLNISQRTVEVHRGRVMEKMQARSIAQLVRMLMQINFQPA